MIGLVEAKQFAKIFKCNRAFFTRNVLPIIAPKEKIKTNITTANQALTDNDFIAHLEGSFAIGVCPTLENGTCWFGCIDIDCYDRSFDVIYKIIQEYHIPLIPCRSKSGGMHCYLVVTDCVLASTMIATLKRIVEMFNLEGIYGKGKVEIFPKQEILKSGGKGSCITLPYFNGVDEDTYTYAYNYQGGKVKLKQFLANFNQKMTPISSVIEVLDNLPLADAPPCIQYILLNAVVGGEGSHRNDFLVNYGVYAKKKFGDDFGGEIEKVNGNFAKPLERKEVENIISSIQDNEYNYMCKRAPLCDYCNSKKCKEREYGVGRQKGHFTGIDYGQLIRYKAAEPYYIWKLRLQGQDKNEFKDVIFRNEKELLDQKTFAQMCMRYLNTTPISVSANDWAEVLNTVLRNIEEVEVSIEQDASALAELKRTFIQYLSNKQAKRDQPFLVNMGLSYLRTITDREGNITTRYFFKAEGFASYCRQMRVPYEEALLAEHLRRFGAIIEEMVYTSISGEQRVIKCMSVASNEELENMRLVSEEVEAYDKAKIAKELEFTGEGQSEATIEDVEELQAKLNLKKLEGEENESDVF